VYLNLQAATPELVSCLLADKKLGIFLKNHSRGSTKTVRIISYNNTSMEGISFLAFCFTYSFDLQQKKSGQTHVD
jgi:hypothetical protein